MWELGEVNLSGKFSQTKLNPLKWPLVCLSGLLVIILYCSFTFLSFLFFPHPFTPFDNFLSQLGDSDLNPEGAIFYFMAVISTGLMGLGFYWGLCTWYTQNRENRVLKVSFTLGLLNSLAIIMSGVFSESVNYPIHFLSSFLIFFTFFPILILINGSLLSHPDFNRIISYYGFLVALIDFIFILMALAGGEIFDRAAIMEWLTVFAYFGWVGLIVFNTFKEI
jgi:hypothetical protein